MKTAAEIYPDYADKESESGSFYGPSDYQPILDSFGQIAAQEDEQGYQGDSWVLYLDGERWGYLQFGWGSCSGCDSLQACDSLAEIDSLINDLAASIKWFDSRESALAFFESHDWEGDYSSQKDECKRFVTNAKKLLGGLQ